MNQQILMKLPNEKFYTNHFSISPIVTNGLTENGENNGRISSTLVANEPKCNLGLIHYHICVYVCVDT